MPKERYDDITFWDEDPIKEDENLYSIDGYVYSYNSSTGFWERQD